MLTMKVQIFDEATLLFDERHAIEPGNKLFYSFDQCPIISKGVVLHGVVIEPSAEYWERDNDKVSGGQ